jgi:hypothetical protein
MIWLIKPLGVIGANNKQEENAEENVLDLNDCQVNDMA